MAAMTFDVADSEGQVRYNQLMQRLQVNFEPAPGTQKAADITADLASAQKAMETAKDRHVQTTAALTDLLQNIENVPIEETTAQILALQTSLQASLQTTALLSKLSLVNYL
jgi:flagellin-like hook-associated protein FlgL